MKKKEDVTAEKEFLLFDERERNMYILFDSECLGLSKERRTCDKIPKGEIFGVRLARRAPYQPRCLTRAYGGCINIPVSNNFRQYTLPVIYSPGPIRYVSYPKQ